MPKRNITWLALAATFFAATAFATGDPRSVAGDVHPGVYYCVTDRMTGFQGDAKHRYAGSISPGPDSRRFVVKISLIPPLSTAPGDTATSTESCRKSIGIPLPPFALWWNCDATYKAEFSKDMGVPEMHGDSSAVFRGNFFGEFHIFKDLSFILVRTDFDGNFYMQEGTCDRFDH